VNEDADHRYMMFSATFNRECRRLARKFLAEDHVRIRIGRPGSTHINVDQTVSNLKAQSETEASLDFCQHQDSGRFPG
jgi:superfamily II DNA/RNA helicase